MRRSPLVIALALAAVTACGSDSPTNPPLFIPDSGSAGPQFLQGVLELTEDVPPQYALRLDNSNRVLLDCEFVVVDEAMLGTVVLVRGRYDLNGDYIVESLHKITEKPTDLDVQKGGRQLF